MSIKEYRLSEIDKLAAESPDCIWEFVRGNFADCALADNFEVDTGKSVISERRYINNSCIFK